LLHDDVGSEHEDCGSQYDGDDRSDPLPGSRLERLRAIRGQLPPP
jgi:hypothetical protein